MIAEFGGDAACQWAHQRLTHRFLGAAHHDDARLLLRITPRFAPCAGRGRVSVARPVEQQLRSKRLLLSLRFGGRIARIARRRGLGRCGFLGVGFIVLCGSRSTCRQRPGQQERHYGDGCPDSPSAVCAHGVHSFSLPLPCPCIIDAIRRTTAIWTANMRNGLANPCLSAQMRISSPCGLRARAVSARRRASRRRTRADSR